MSGEVMVQADSAPGDASEKSPEQQCRRCEFGYHMRDPLWRYTEFVLCRRFPPADVGGHGAFFPKVHKANWCGEFKPSNDRSGDREVEPKSDPLE